MPVSREQTAFLFGHFSNFAKTKTSEKTRTKTKMPVSREQTTCLFGHFSNFEKTKTKTKTKCKDKNK